MTQDELQRLRELEELDSDGVKLSAEEYEELNRLISIEEKQWQETQRWAA